MTSKKKKMILLSALAASAALQPGNHAFAACTSAAISINFVTPTFKWPTILPCSTGNGTVTIKPGGLAQTVGCVAGTFGAGQDARVQIKSNQTGGTADVVVVKVTPTIELAKFNSINNVAVGTFQITNQGTAMTLKGNTTVTLNLGATMKFSANQTSGVYKGTFIVDASCL